MTKINRRAQCASPDQSYAIMLAKLLMIAMEDFQAMGMEDWSLRLQEGVNELMARYELKPEDVRLLQGGMRH